VTTYELWAHPRRGEMYAFRMASYVKIPLIDVKVLLRSKGIVLECLSTCNTVRNCPMVAFTDFGSLGSEFPWGHRPPVGAAAA
jgi:hypothetical protein